MAAKTLRVPAGKQATLSLDHADEIGAMRVALRPKSPAALQLLFGIRPPKAIRISDSKSFERPSSTKKLVELRADKAGLINGVKPSSLYHIVRSLPDQARMPASVAWTAKSRAWFTASGRPLAKGEKEDGMVLREVGDLGIQQIAIYDWLAKLQIYRIALWLQDIIVERNATLHIDHALVSARNFLIHRGGRVIQDAPALVVDLAGQLHGDID